MNIQEHLKNSCPCESTNQPSLNEQIDNNLFNLSEFGSKAVSNFIKPNDGFLNSMYYNVLQKNIQHAVELTEEQKEFIAKYENKQASNS